MVIRRWFATLSNNVGTAAPKRWHYCLAKTVHDDTVILLDQTDPEVPKGWGSGSSGSRAHGRTPGVTRGPFSKRRGATADGAYV